MRLCFVASVANLPKELSGYSLLVALVARYVDACSVTGPSTSIRAKDVLVKHITQVLLKHTTVSDVLMVELCIRLVLYIQPAITGVHFDRKNRNRCDLHNRSVFEGGEPHVFSRC